MNNNGSNGLGPMPRLVSIPYTPADIAERKPDDRFARVALDRTVLVADHGIDGDQKGGPGKRQLNVMRAEVVAGLAAEGFHTAPGALGEQLVIGGLDDSAFAPGKQLRISSAAVIELIMPRTGCARFEAIQGKPRSSADGRIGVMARVVTGGPIAVGDEVSPE
jgi:MOSC domain-containing protein YiiM